jgi:hypothetical protein
MTDDAKTTLARIDERLKAHVDSQDEWQKATSVEMRALKLSVGERCDKLTESVACHNVRLDRVEQKEKGRAKLTWIAIGSGFGALIAWIARHWK